MPGVRRWALLSALLAPCSLLLGMIVGASRQPASFDSGVDTISALAALGAPDRWIMTSALWVLGLCHLSTAAGLGSSARGGRLLLALGGLMTLLVAVFPLSAVGANDVHLAVATATFVSLAVWPLFADRRLASRLAGGVLLGLLGWLKLALQTGQLLGLAERVVAVAEAIWPLCAVLLGLRRESRL